MKSTELRKNIYNIQYQIIETGIPVPIERKGKQLKIILEEPLDKLKKLPKKNDLNVPPDSIINLRNCPYKYNN